MLNNRVETWFEQWKQQGLEEGRQKGLLEGRQEGRQEGRAEGKAKTLDKQLQLRFGQLPDAMALRLQQAGEAELDLWAERILFVDTLDAVFADV